MNSFLLALQFLTRIPSPSATQATPEALGRSTLYYPAIGALIGLMLIAVANILSSEHANLSAAIILTLWVAITGGLHLDGIADCVDGWVGGQGDMDKSLIIMKDPNAGPMGVIALVLVLLLKFSAISVLVTEQSFAILFIAPILGRASISFLMLSTTYLRSNGLAKQLNQHLSRQQAITVLLLTIVLSVFIAGFTLTAFLIASAYLLRAVFLKLFNGTTGDMYGASVELIETLCLILGVVIFQPL